MLHFLGFPKSFEITNYPQKTKKPTTSYHPALRTFAQNVNYHSLAAYQDVRKAFSNRLPCVEILKSLNSSKNYNPINYLKKIKQVTEIVSRIEAEKGRKLYFGPTFDQICIKKSSDCCTESKE